MDRQSIKKRIAHIKEYITKLSKRTKRIALIVLAALVVLALGLTILLNRNASDYTVLYENISAAEAGSIYQELLGMGAQPKINNQGEVMIPSDEYDIWVLQLAAKGYPRTALPYDVFSSHTGLTTTETERKQWLVYQLQNRLQSTLSRIGGVENATVTITIPEEDKSIWAEAETEKASTAGVLLTLRSGYSPTPEQVTAIKNLISSSVPEMEPTAVTVVDSVTGLELLGSDNTQGITPTMNLEYEQTVQRQIEENIVRVLTPRYGAQGVVAVAKVTIDYDRMMTEDMQLQENPETGNGYLTKDQGRYTINGETPASGIVGEENNDDIPTYAYKSPTGKDGMTYYWWDKDYDYGYIKTQIEHGNAVLKRATVSVVVEETRLTDALREELTSLISGSTDIEPSLVFVSSFDRPEVTPPTPDDTSGNSILQKIPLWAFIAIGVGLLLLIAIIVLLIKRHLKKRRLAKLRMQQENEEELRRKQEEELAAYKAHLTDKAGSDLDAKEEAVMDEVRDYVKENPEATASLLRSWLKED